MEHQFQQLSPHVFIMHAEHETDRPILAAIIGTRRTLLLDAGNSPAHAQLFREKLEKRGIRQPDIVALTHWHWDHSFGTEAWGVPVIAHAETGRMLAALSGVEWSESSLEKLVRDGTINEGSANHIRLEYGDPGQIRFVAPDILFTDRMTIDLGGMVCELIHVGGDHSEDSCILYVREDQVLFLGDALAPSIYGGPWKYSSSEFIRLLELAYGYRASWYVESHGIPMTESDFRADLAPWAHLAHVVERLGPDRAPITNEMKAFLGLEHLPSDLEKGIDYFLAGRADTSGK